MELLLLSLRKPVAGEAWQVDVFFFLALDDPPDGKIDKWRVQRDVKASEIRRGKEALARH